jgi:hypothetical protein
MTDARTLDDTINKAAFWSAMVLILAGVLSVFFPLDAPEGPFSERMLWFSSNVSVHWSYSIRSSPSISSS